jgi:membrane-bound lytic murein transglycosylase D
MHDIVPGASQEYILRIPYQYTNTYIEHEDSLYTYMVDSLFKPATLKAIEEGRASGGGRITYKVKSGDYLGRIASRYHVSINQIKQWNHLRSNNLRVGQILYIYGRGSGPASQEASSKPVSGTKAATGSKPASGSGYTVYTVKRGDTLYEIAARYPGISAQDIMKYNGISSKIRIGQKIKIPNR